ncbi:MAG: oligopeptidase A [Gammaproteobacteria bacterium]|jgi:oligopeptidase A
MANLTTNPLLEDAPLPAFDSIRAEHIVPAVQQALDDARCTLRQVTDCTAPPDWDCLLMPMEVMGERLDRIWSPVRHLHSVMDSAPLREAYEACLPLLTGFYTELSQNTELYRKYRELAKSPAYDALPAAAQRVVDNALRDFVLGGVALEGEARERFAAIATRLSELSSQFSNNVLDANQSWTHSVTDADTLAGLPESALALARQSSQQAGDDQAWRLTLDLPCYLPVMTYAHNAQLREQMYRAYVTRASDQGPDEARFDNSDLMKEILALRQEKAQLLGLDSYAHLSVQRKMAGSPQQVLEFLRDLAARARPVAEAERQQLQDFAARAQGEGQGGEQLRAWDLAYYSEQLKREQFNVSQEDFRPYLPVDHVIRGMFSIAERLFGVRINERKGIATWHGDVTYYEIQDASSNPADEPADATLLGALYLDPFARAHKRGGAWMDVCRSRMRMGDQANQPPVAYLTCNFTPPVNAQTALITHDEVTTLFHEFGHGLHHMLTQVDIPSVAGISGVEWDAVELPSQFMENWCFEPEALALFAAHHETGEPIPADLLDRLRAARNFQSGMQMLRQVELALFDFRLHLEYTNDTNLLALLDEVRDEVAVLRPPPFNRFAHAFGHIFSGGYAAGYYSYKWAEVLSSDAYSRFEEQGVFDVESGRAFRREILERGGTRDALTSFVAFRGREPDVSALLRHSAIEPAPQPPVSAE